jgi:hypothetical protein
LHCPDHLFPTPEGLKSRRRFLAAIQQGLPMWLG